MGDIQSLSLSGGDTMNRAQAKKLMEESFKRSTETLNLMYLYRQAMEANDQGKLGELSEVIRRRDEGNQAE